MLPFIRSGATPKTETKTLIVDDRLSLRTLIRAVLQQTGIASLRKVPDGEGGGRDLIARARQLGVNIYRIKPFKALTLKTKVEGVFGVIE